MSIYVRISTVMPKDPKVRRAGALAELLYVRSILFSKEMMSDGQIDESQLDYCAIGIPGDHQELANKLVEVGLWQKNDTGWQIPFEKWRKWQTTSDEVEAIRKKKAEAGEKGANKRWGKSRTSDNSKTIAENGKTDGKSIAPAIPANSTPIAEVDFANGKKWPETETETETETVVKEQSSSYLKIPREPDADDDENFDTRPQYPPGRNLTSSLTVPPILQPELNLYTAEVQQKAWDVCREFDKHSPGSRGSSTWVKICQTFADCIAQNPGAADKLIAYFRESNPEIIQREIKAGIRLPPGSKPYRVCDKLFPPARASPTAKQTESAPQPDMSFSEILELRKQIPA